jgi:hypothetical protein
MKRLLHKYKAMLHLRSADSATLSERDRLAAVRALAKEFPGSLRELDGWTLSQIGSRVAALENLCANANAPPPEPWMLAQDAFHKAIIELLHQRRSEQSRPCVSRVPMTHAAIATVAEQLALPSETIRAWVLPS